MNEVKCTICQADFREEAITYSPANVPKCGSCATEFPHARTREEVQVKNSNKAQTLSESRVLELVYGVFEEANIKRHKCENCGAMFFRHTPMQVLCHKCVKNEATAEKETK